MFSALCISGFFHFLQTAVFAVGYISGTSLFPEPLSSEEERIYLEKLSTGDEDARNILIERNLRLVAHVCKKYSNSNVDQDDLISIGTIGLIKGINSFKPEKGARLSTYVSRCIDNEILMHFRADKKNSKNVSIYDGISYDKEGNEVTILDVLKTEDPDFNEEIYKNDNIKLLKEYMNILTPRERDVLTKRYGLDNSDEITQKEIAKNLGISRSYVSRIEKRAITKILREFIKNDTKK